MEQIYIGKILASELYEHGEQESIRFGDDIDMFKKRGKIEWIN